MSDDVTKVMFWHGAQPVRAGIVSVLSPQFPQRSPPDWDVLHGGIQKISAALGTKEGKHTYLPITLPHFNCEHFYMSAFCSAEVCLPFSSILSSGYKMQTFSCFTNSKNGTQSVHRQSYNESSVYLPRSLFDVDVEYSVRAENHLGNNLSDVITLSVRDIGQFLQHKCLFSFQHCSCIIECITLFICLCSYPQHPRNN